MRRATIVRTLALTAAAAAPPGFAGCGDDGGGDGRAGGQGATRTAAIADNGCLACHRLQGEGNAQPGGDLSGVGARLTPQELRLALIDPPDGMPSYSRLSSDELDELVAALRRLR